MKRPSESSVSVPIIRRGVAAEVTECFRGVRTAVALIALMTVASAQQLAAQECSISGEKVNDIRLFRRCLADHGLDAWGAIGTLEETVLHYAARRTSNPNIIRLLLEAGADPNAPDLTGSTPLHAAAFNDYAIVSSLLLDAGARPNVRSNAGWSPLHAAIRSENRLTVSILLDGGADVNARIYDEQARFPLHLAAEQDDPVLVAMLLDGGADLHAADADGYTALHRAAAITENEGVVRALLDRGADPVSESDDGRMPLHSALRYRAEPGYVSALLQAGAGEPLTPLQLSVLQGDTTGVNWLLANEADPNETDRYGWGSLHFAVPVARLEMVSSLLAAGADPNVRTVGGATALHLAARHAPGSVVAALLGAGADPNARDSEGGWRPLHYAAMHQEEALEAVIASLLDAGADPGSSDASDDDNGYSPLHLALMNPAVTAPVVQALLDAGADPMARGRGGETPLHIAVRFEDDTEDMATIIESLVGAGADRRAENEYGTQPADYAGRGSQALWLLVVAEGMLAPGRFFNNSLSSSDGVWHDGSHYDAWTVTAEKMGQRVVIDMESDDVDAYLTVFRTDGTPVATDDDSGSGSNARVEFRAVSAGEYFVIATSYGVGETGGYRVRVR